MLKNLFIVLALVNIGLSTETSTEDTSVSCPTTTPTETLAVISWNKKNVRVYHAHDGVVDEWCYDGGSWYVGSFSATGKTVSAVAWNTVNIRVYVGDGTNIVEYCWDGKGWYVGSFTAEGVVTGSTSWLSGSNIIIKVYVKTHLGNIEEHTYNKGWSVTSTFG
ncbi:unnamed protein product [Blepharisma stoltei]|uniref:Fucose-specific lectin n=1 Tax=Blepharisma stoltei TaxID=1481888 RepID=A0AAU9IW56_9CILI|nr:unnamed protein product [Blepharisma stoltei]